MPRLTLYSRPGCHLCDDMRAIVGRVIAQLPAGAAELAEIDVSADDALERRYGHDVPVLFIDGEEAARHRITGEVLRRKLGM